MSADEGKFILKKKTSFKDMAAGLEQELPESDLCFQDGEHVFQYKFEKPEDDREYEIEPGSFVFTKTAVGLQLVKLQFKKRALLETSTNTAKIMGEAKKFFSRLHVYEKLQRPKKRGVLLYSAPGMGKTSSIEKVCSDLMSEDAGTVIIVWPTSEIEADDIVKLLSTNSRYTAECTRMVLIIEDIGGGERESHRSNTAVDSGLLNLLDGVGVVFQLPTFIIATTNHPENLLASLADRPGRFDLMLKLQPPSHTEKIALMKFICKRDLNQDEQDSLAMKGSEEFSVAHLEEIAVRAELDDKSHAQVIKEMIDHTALFKRDFEDKNRKLGISFNDD
jgi:SpoVK/Ycf46/Vps4 family AAA+-type ATPase